MMNPYVGPRTFTQAESHLFFGREQEARDLFSRVISERLLLFYATSGAGKSSILQTRLMPQLQEKGWIVLPVARVSGALPTGMADVPNIYRFNLMLSLDRSQRDPQRLVDLSLAQFLRQLSSDDDGATFYYVETEAETAPSTTPYILIIDQFEELLTTHAPLWPHRAEFLRELNETLRADPMLTVLLTLREDYVAALDPYAQWFDNSLRARFYMTRMGYEAALTAVTEPAKLGQRPFTADAARQLVANLSQVKSNLPSPLPLSQKERGDMRLPLSLSPDSVYPPSVPPKGREVLLPLPLGEGWGEGEGAGEGKLDLTWLKFATNCLAASAVKGRWPTLAGSMMAVKAAL